MTRGHTQTKRKSETPSERKARLGGYAKDIKQYQIDTKKNSDAKRIFHTPPYYLRKKEEEECQKSSKKDITN